MTAEEKIQYQVKRYQVEKQRQHVNAEDAFEFVLLGQQMHI